MDFCTRKSSNGKWKSLQTRDWILAILLTASEARPRPTAQNLFALETRRITRTALHWPAGRLALEDGKTRVVEGLLGPMLVFLFGIILAKNQLPFKPMAHHVTTLPGHRVKITFHWVVLPGRTGCSLPYKFEGHSNAFLSPKKCKNERKSPHSGMLDVTQTEKISNERFFPLIPTSHPFS